MSVQTTNSVPESIHTVYVDSYMAGAKNMRVYDQLAAPYTNFAGGKTMGELMRGDQVQVFFISKMTPGTSTISETSDVTPQTLREAIATIDHTSRGEAIQWTEKLVMEALDDYTQKAYEAVGENAQETIEFLAAVEANTGTWVERTTARASLDAGTSTHRASDALFRKYEAMMRTLRVPGFVNENGEANTWTAIMHPFVFHDIAESGNVDSIGLYQQAGIHLNFELGQLGPFRLVSTPFSKVFGAAGADNGTNVATTLGAAADPLATTIVTAADVAASATAGLLWTIGTEETGDTHYPTNERVKVLSASGTTVTILGEGPNGGLRYRHEVGEGVRNADSVYPIVFGGPESLVKLFAEDIGEFGKTVGPKTSGLLDQFNSLGWKWYGGYNLISQNRILRAEVATSYEA